jgi:hypothetical protein
MQLLIDPVDGSMVGSRLLMMAEINPSEYEIWPGRDSSRSRVVLVFKSSRYRALGVYMEIDRYDAQHVLLRTDTVGTRGDTAKFLQEQPGNQQPTHPTWELVWRNCYRVPANVAPEDIAVKVFKGLPGFEGTSACKERQEVNGVVQEPYLQILGLDQWNNDQPGTRLPDGGLDFRVEVFRPEWGLIIFPHRAPFNSDTTFTDQSGYTTHPLELRIQSLYDYLSKTERTESSAYFLQITIRIPN